MIKRIFLLLTFLSFSLTATQAQIVKVVEWTYTVEQTDKEATLVFKATVKDKYHLYSQFLESADGPLPTTFNLNKNKNFTITGKVSEQSGEEVFDQVFQMKVKYFSHETEFRQKIKINSLSKFNINGTIDYMACDDRSCVMEQADFEFVINPNAKPAAEVKDTATTVAIAQPLVDTTQETQTVIDTNIINQNQTVNLNDDCGNWASGDFVADNSFWGIFIAGFIGGLLALLTPCVFPMIPMTVSFFTKRSSSKRKGVINAFIYALSIIVIYVAIGFFVTITLGSDALNDLSTNGFFNMAFFVIFIIFAMSFFGAFEIVLPSWMVNKADAQSDKGGLLGIFFMAFTLSLVSFSCTGPIIGTLLVEAAHGRSYLGPVTGMTGFAVALALPFALFAAFPGWLNSLPKSGGWLNSVKVCLGFIELALALKFLSNVDLAYHWDFLKREIFIACWVVIFGMMGLYLLGKLKFSHDSDIGHISVTRFMFALITLCFAAYMTPGIWGAPVKLLSGILPPEYYKEWRTTTDTDCPHNLSCFHDYDEGMAYAKTQNKPVLIDFTGYNCANCRKMEDDVWSDPKVLKKLSDDYVLISLYVDDKTEMPEDKQYISKFNGKKIKTKGNRWSEMQAMRYNANTQPMYVLVDHKEQTLAKPWSGYENNSAKYAQFLDEGLCRFEKGK
ncbi:MAG: thioredoxin family protein [Bacteroidetes bacterium]|nr:thioredoxin family protein [Bacteroidota bacterium]HNR18537.1 cytochrome c biogenesis protein CcdA [Bacteroidia bacterium]HNU32080.1 cytochrome c biogenesis protein CcdA [Bacteroidia bacterium]